MFGPSPRPLRPRRPICIGAAESPRFGSLKATPLVVDGMMYVSTPLYQAAGIDAKTGKTLWVYDPKSYAAGTPTNSLMWNARGCAYWCDAQQSRVIWGTGDGYLIAVDAKTGRPCLTSAIRDEST